MLVLCDRRPALAGHLHIQSIDFIDKVTVQLFSDTLSGKVSRRFVKQTVPGISK